MPETTPRQRLDMGPDWEDDLLKELSVEDRQRLDDLIEQRRVEREQARRSHAARCACKAPR